MSAFHQILASATDEYNANPDSEHAREEMHRAQLAAELHDAIAQARSAPSDEAMQRLRAARDALRDCIDPKAPSRSNQERPTEETSHSSAMSSRTRTSPTTSFSIGPLERVLRAMSDDPESLLFGERTKPQR